MDKVLTAQNAESSRWTPGFRKLFEPRMHELAIHLDECMPMPTYVRRVDAMYSS